MSEMDAVALLHRTLRNQPADTPGGEPTTDLGRLEARVRRDRDGARLVSLWRDGKRLTNWARS